MNEGQKSRHHLYRGIKIQHSFMIKTLKGLGVERNYLNTIKAI